MCKDSFASRLYERFGSRIIGEARPAKRITEIDHGTESLLTTTFQNDNKLYTLKRFVTNALPPYILLLCAMPPSIARLRWQALTTAIKATILHYTSKKYPRDWSLAFHIQFAVLRKLDASMLNWTVEEVLSSEISLIGLDTKLFNELPF